MSKLEPRIRLYWSKKENDLMCNWEEGTSKSDAKILLRALNPDDGLLAELNRRGYDLETIRFQIRKKNTTPALVQLAEEAE